LRTLHAENEIAPLVDARQACWWCSISAHASAPNCCRGGSAPLQVIVDGRNSNTAMIALNYTRSIVDRYNRDMDRAARGLRGPPARLEIRAWFNPNLESRWFFIPGIIGMLTLVTTMLVTALTVAREREQGTFDQLLVTPLRPGKSCSARPCPASSSAWSRAR
jgi:ABC-2 type transport system permease protein